MSDGNIEKAGLYQAEAYLAGNTLDLMLQDSAPATQEDAYKVQQVFVDRLSQTKGSLGGYKIAYTSAVMREARGISNPCAGVIFADTIFESPKELKGADYIKLAIECEVGVRLGSEVKASGAPYTRDTIAPHIHSLMTAFEIVDIRPVGLPEGVDPAISSIVTNIFGGGAVLGTEITDWKGIDLPASKGTKARARTSWAILWRLWSGSPTTWRLGARACQRELLSLPAASFRRRHLAPVTPLLSP
jgi:2-keto-4-pentenoate hydratase